MGHDYKVTQHCADLKFSSRGSQSERNAFQTNMLWGEKQVGRERESGRESGKSGLS
jgi:hypothetical protein